MNTKFLTKSVVIVILLIAFSACEAQSIKKENTPQANKVEQIMILNFENVPIGKIPAKWKIENTNPCGPLQTWKVIKNTSAPSGKRVLALMNTKKSKGDSFNLCWTKDVSFTDGEVEVELKAGTGEEDQGGGVIWRALDKNNYYVARFNPLEDNFRIYYVKDSKRKKIKSANIKLPAGEWVKLKIVQRGNTFECYLNGKKFIEGTDDTFTKSGGVGLWTKADAATSFDNFTVILYKKAKK
ncbi:MAG: hypothetical protein DRI44_09650 [Chlamydiae bacterium]|nr:MAG: hypothetical protein DRI44_09650 [Chlamydiota bacterium]